MRAERAPKFFYKCAGCQTVRYSENPLPFCCSEQCETEAKNPTAVRRRYQQSYVYKIAPELLSRFLAILAIFPELAHAIQSGTATMDEVNEIIWNEYLRVIQKVEDENAPHIILWPEERF